MKLKIESIKEPDQYLGAEIKKFTIPDDGTGKSVTCWALSSNKYIKQAITEVELTLHERGQTLPRKTTSPLSSGYRPELDFTQELDAEGINYYQGLIGILRWICELGRIDIVTPVSLLARFMVSPRIGHLMQIYHLFAYLKSHDRSTIVFDPTEPIMNDTQFHTADWQEYYPDAKESIPPNMPIPLGKSVSTTCFVDADHAGCHVTRRSQTGILIYVNRAPIIWYSKRQNTVESSTFGSEFIAMKTAIELIEGLRYKLRMFGIPIEGPTSIFCDNEAVTLNSTHPESTLKRKHTSIAYHRVREAQAAGYVRIGRIEGSKNLADVLTKLLPGPRLKELIVGILW